MRGVAGVERQAQDIGRTFRQPLGRVAQAACPHILHDRHPDPGFERARHVKFRDTASIGDIGQRKLVAEIPFDHPDYFCSQ